MISDVTAKILGKLSGVRRNGDGWTACCPSHDDTNPSLSVSVSSDDGRVLLHCHAGCTADAIVKSVGLTLADLFPSKNGKASSGGKAMPGKNPSDGNRDGEKHRRTLLFTSPEAAVAKMAGVYGEPKRWDYHNLAREVVGVAFRFETPNGKTIVPVSLDPTYRMWANRAMGAPRPIYGLPKLMELAGQTVFVVEGEKCADALGAIGLLATTSAGGSNAGHLADWTPLAGRTIVVIPDNDAPGEKYADTVIQTLLRLPETASVSILRLPDLPEGGDACDFIHARITEDAATPSHVRDTILSLVGNIAEPVELACAKNIGDSVTTDKTPSGGVENGGFVTEGQKIGADDDAGDEFPDAAPLLFEPFPTALLPAPLDAFVAETADAIGCDESLIALPALAVVGSMIGNARRIMLKRKWREPPVLWAAIVGESGGHKTPAIRSVLEPVREQEERAYRDYQAEMVEHEYRHAAYRKAMTAWERSSGARDGDMPTEPVAPKCQRSTVNDTTIEALAPILLDNPRGLLLVADELAGWINSFDRYSTTGRGGGDTPRWLSMHSAEAVTIDRKSGPTKTIRVPMAFVGVLGGVQPGILRRCVGEEHQENGLLQRLLLVMPPRKAKRWTENDISERTQQRYGELLNRLRALDFDVDQYGNERPRYLTFTPGGKRVWVDFYNRHADEQADLSGTLAGAWSKLEAYAARFATIIHCVRAVAGNDTLRDASEVDERSMTAAVGLTRWFANETRRVHAAILSEDEGSREVRLLVDHIQGKGGSVTPRDLMRMDRKKYPTSDAAMTALRKLAADGIGTIEHEPARVTGGRPTIRFCIAKRTPGDKTPSGGVENGGFVNCHLSPQIKNTNTTNGIGEGLRHEGQPQGPTVKPVGEPVRCGRVNAQKRAERYRSEYPDGVPPGGRRVGPADEGNEKVT